LLVQQSPRPVSSGAIPNGIRQVENHAPRCCAESWSLGRWAARAQTVIAARYRCAKAIPRERRRQDYKRNTAPSVAFATVIRTAEKSFVKRISSVAFGSDIASAAQLMRLLQRAPCMRRCSRHRLSPVGLGVLHLASLPRLDLVIFATAHSATEHREPRKKTFRPRCMRAAKDLPFVNGSEAPNNHFGKFP
jgi:hypothetical protein